MAWQNAIYMAVLIIAGGIYWWVKLGRFGSTKNFYANKLGLGEGEEIVESWSAAYHIERSVASYAWEAVSGRGKRGATLIVAMTSWNRFAIGAMETSDAPIHFQQGEVFASGSRAKPKYKHFGGTHGWERTAVVLLRTVSGHEIVLDAPRPCLQRLQAWSSTSSAVQAAPMVHQGA